MNETKIHFKMYKAGRQWVVAGLVTASILGSSLLFGTNLARADSKNANINNVTEIKKNGDSEKINKMTIYVVILGRCNVTYLI